MKNFEQLNHTPLNRYAVTTTGIFRPSRRIEPSRMSEIEEGEGLKELSSEKTATMSMEELKKMRGGADPGHKVDTG
jgi:hypothetical protein